MNLEISTEQQSPAQFVHWFRTVAPYIHAFRGKTFVVAFGGELIVADKLNSVVQDLSLLQAIGIKLVVVHGSRPQVNAQLHLKQLHTAFAQGLRITTPAALECAKEAAGEIRLDIEALFSQGLPNTAMQNARVRVLSGNFVTARPVGLVDGVDFQHTGYVRKVDVDTLRQVIDTGAIALLSPLGFSPTGEAFNLAMEDVATQCAIGLNADKLIFLTETPALQQHEIEYDDAEKLIASAQSTGNISAAQIDYLRHAVRACKGGVERVHIVPFATDGACLLEIFTHDGIGTMVTEEALESLRNATVDDVAAILTLIEPLEADGTLVKRGRDKIEQEIDLFSVLEHDGKIFGCAALYAYPTERMAEMACLTVSPNAQGTGDGERILKHIEQRARAAGLKQLFVLTTRTMHWFIKRGFVAASVDALPADKQSLYNWQRKSQVLIKTL